MKMDRKSYPPNLHPFLFHSISSLTPHTPKPKFHTLTTSTSTPWTLSSSTLLSLASNSPPNPLLSPHSLPSLSTLTLSTSDPPVRSTSPSLRNSLRKQRRSSKTKSSTATMRMNPTARSTRSSAAGPPRAGKVWSI